MPTNFHSTALQAIVLFTNALEFDPTDHVFWSNRSAALFEKDDFEGARRDAEYCVYLKVRSIVSV
jgi:Flp pilus assembly protein TadD